MTNLTEETYYVCSVSGCSVFVLDKEFISLGCAKHGNTLVKQVRQFEDNKLTSEFTEQPND